jgi:hypothetical protein
VVLVSNALAEGTLERRPLLRIQVNDSPLRTVGQKALAPLTRQNYSRTPQGSYNSGDYYRSRIPRDEINVHKINQAAWGSRACGQLRGGLGLLQRGCAMTTDDETGIYVGQRAGGGCWFTRWHSHCASRGWRKFKRALRRNSRRTISLKRDALNIKLEVNHD